MSGLFSSKTSSSSTSSTKVPQNYQNFLNMSLNRAAAAGDAPFVQYQGQRIADLSGNEQMGIQSAASNYGMYQPLVDMASMSSANLAEKAGRVPTGVELGAFINPYTDYVLGNSLDRLQEQSDINMTKIGSQAGMSGAFGGLRHGVLEGANLAELLKSARDLSGTTYADAYDKGMGNWWKSQDSQRASIDTMLNTVGMGQKYNLNDTDQLMKTGLTERTRNQGLLDFNFGEFMREQEDPLTKASFMSSIAAQYPRDIFTKTTKSESTTTDSPIKTLAGIGIAAAGIMSGNPAAAMSLASGASSLGNNPVGGAAVGSGYTTTPSYVKGGKVKGYKKGGKVKKYADGGILDDIQAWGDKRDMGMVKAGLSMVAGADPLEAMDAYKEHQRYLQGSYAGGGRIGPESDEKRAKRIIASKLPKEEAEREYINSVFDDATKPRSGSFDPLNGDNWGLNIPEGDAGHYDIMRMLGSPRKERPYIGMQSTLRNEYPRYGEKLGDLSYIDADLQLIKNIEKQQDYVARKPLLKNNEKQKAVQASPIKLPSGNPMDAMLKNAKRVPMPEEPYEPVDVDGVPLPVTDAQFKELAAWDKAMMISKLLGTPGYTLADDPSLDPPVYIDDSQFKRVPNDPGYDTRGESYPGEFRSGRKKKYAEGGEVKGYSLGGMLFGAGFDAIFKKKEKAQPIDEGMDYDGMGFSPKGIEFAQNLARGRRERRGQQDPLATAMPVQQPFSWDRFNQARAMNGQLSNLTGGMQPNPAMGQRPDLSGYMTAMQNRMQPQPQQPAFAGGGYVKKKEEPKSLGDLSDVLAGRKMRQIEPHKKEEPRSLKDLKDSLAKEQVKEQPWLEKLQDITWGKNHMERVRKNNAYQEGGDVFVGGRGFGPPTDPLAAISEKFAPLPSASEGINPEIIYSLATQKHETGAKEYGKPNYNARPLDENKVPLSSAAGLGQWLAESWNQIAKRDKTGTIKPRTYKQAMEGHIPSKEEQRLAWPIWMEIQKEQMGEENFNKLNNRFAHHQLGQGDYKKLLQANPDKKMREVFGDKVARNVSAFSKDKKGNIVKNETVYEYLNRLDQSMKDAEAWYLQNQENPGDVVYYGGLDPQAVAKKSLPQQAAAEVDPLAGIADVEKRSRAIDALREKEQYDAERRNWRNDLNIAQLGSNEIQMSPMEGGPRTQGRPVSPQENIANKIKSKTPIEALELFATQSKYSDPIDQMLYAPKVFPGTGTTKKNYRQEQLDKFLKAKGIGTKDALSEAWNSDVDSKMQEVIGDLGIENEGPYRKGGRNFAEGGTVSGNDYYYQQVNKQRAAMGLPPIEDVTASSWGDVATGFDDYSKGVRANAGEIISGADSRASRAASLFDTLGRGAALTIPMINDAVGQVGRGGANVMSYLFDPMDPSYNKSKSPLEQAQPSVPKGAFSGPNFFDSASDDVAAYYSELGDMTGADPLNAALAQGEPSAPMADAVGSGIAKDDDEALLKKMMHDRIIAMNEDKGPQQPTLFGLNVNMDLVKLGLGMLASDKNFGGALGESGMNLIQDKEREELRKSKENSEKLQELLDLRYKNAMMESMDPEVKAELARQKAASDMRLEELKHKSKLDEIRLQQSSILSKDITKKEIERIQAKIAEDEMLTESEKSMLWAHGIDYEQPIKAGSWYDLD